MELLELELIRFGKFADHTIRLTPGINIIYGSNESGKTTIHSFIRAMLFGRGDGSDPAWEEQCRGYRPWDNGILFSGRMKVRKDQQTWILERQIERSEDIVQVVEEKSGRKLADAETFLRDLTGGISEQVFVNTVFLGQESWKTGEGLAEALRRFSANTDLPSSEQMDVNRALEELEAKKRQLKEQEEKGTAVQGMPVSGGTDRIDNIPFRSGSRYDRETADRAAGHERDHKSMNYRRILTVLLITAAVLAAAASVLLDMPGLQIFLGIFSGLFLLCLIPVWIVGREKTEGIDLDEEVREMKVRNMRSQPAVSGSASGRPNEPGNHPDRQNRPSGAFYKSGMTRNEMEIQALDLAIRRIRELSSGFLRGPGLELERLSSEILRAVTDGRYAGILLDDNLSVRVQGGDRIVEENRISRGTRQQIYFALRMAAGTVFAGEELPIILDEPFSMYDDTRLEAVLRWLYESRRQVILFTCQERERRILERIRTEKKENS